MKIFKHICLAACVIGSTAACYARSYDDIIESDFISVAIYRDYPPFSYLVDDEPKGIDVEIAQQIAKQMGLELKLKWMTADENVEDDLRNNLWKGHYLERTVADLMLRVPYDKAYTLSRDDIGELVHEQVHMFAPYHTESWQIIYDSSKIDSVSTMAVFQYHSIGVEVDSIPQFYLSSALGGRMRDSAQHFPTTVEAVEAMQAGQVDAVMGLRSQVSYLQGQLNREQYQLATNAFPMIGQQQWEIGMAVKSQYRQLGYAVGDIVQEMIEQGQMQSIFDKYHAIYQASTSY
ncbi:substrate-binding periplasmic protein [Vibrio japonicus]|uniref:Transporter substrate-binding domain-containing protein n=1 Tax=Vibrio japonicus TaxID=1824638 RepID=A0ABY5LBY0_9VIBR|nr:transporter substrate-binding domain-containing protein [Vibrio japonicus]UUM29559.1 transporter substrate-binding domain-containing protein [Vibrio japonicus]